MQISLTKFRNEMFKLLPNLKGNDLITLTYEGKAAYIVKKISDSRNERFKEELKHCPKLGITTEQVLALKNERRR